MIEDMSGCSKSGGTSFYQTRPAHLTLPPALPHPPPTPSHSHSACSHLPTTTPCLALPTPIFNPRPAHPCPHPPPVLGVVAHVRVVFAQIEVQRVRRHVLHLHARRVAQELEVLVHELLHLVQVLEQNTGAHVKLPRVEAKNNVKSFRMFHAPSCRWALGGECTDLFQPGALDVARIGPIHPIQRRQHTTHPA